MIDKARISDPTTHYGDGKHATQGFKLQRITGALNIFFLGFFVWFVVTVAGEGRAELVETLRNPFVAIMLALLIISVAVHMRIGLHEVIDDYVSEGPRHRLAVAANTAFVGIVALVSLLSIAKILFWG